MTLRCNYSRSDEHLSYWRTSGGYEVDAIIGKGRLAIEIKSTNEVKSRHLHGLKAFKKIFRKHYGTAKYNTRD